MGRLHGIIPALEPDFDKTELLIDHRDLRRSLQQASLFYTTGYLHPNVFIRGRKTIIGMMLLLDLRHVLCSFS